MGDMMASSKLVGLLFDAWADIDRAVEGLSAEQAMEQVQGGSSFAWTYAHLGNNLDRWINQNFRGRALHPLIGQELFRAGGPGATEDWEGIRGGGAGGARSGAWLSR